jgi:hypothetical protein
MERYVCMDLGNFAQNIYLQTFGLKIGRCAVGNFDYDRVKKVVNICLRKRSIII